MGKVGNAEIAFCFLIYDKIDHRKIWEKFFDQDIDKTANIYAHIKQVTYRTPKWIKEKGVETVYTAWCDVGLVHAFNQMIRQALKNPKNKYFCLLSGSCIPLYSYPKTYEKITATKKARLAPFPDFTGIIHEYQKNEQWTILNRKVAQDILRLSDSDDIKAQEYLETMLDLIDTDSIRAGCPDELFLINWLLQIYGKNFSRNVELRKTTYTLWSFDQQAHPKKFNAKDIDEYKESICESGAIFARKFTTSAAKKIAMKC